MVATLETMAMVAAMRAVTARALAEITVTRSVILPGNPKKSLLSISRTVCSLKKGGNYFISHYAGEVDNTYRREPFEINTIHVF